MGTNFSVGEFLRDHMQVLKVIDDLSFRVDVLRETPHKEILSPA